MKFIAKRDFYRTSELAEVEIVDACKGATKDSPHANHIHRGAIIELGKVTSEAELQTKNDPQKLLIAQLRYAGCIGDASDKDVVKRVEADIETDRKRDETVAKRNAQTSSDEVASKLLALMTKAAAAPAK